MPGCVQDRPNGVGLVLHQIETVGDLVSTNTLVRFSPAWSSVGEFDMQTATQCMAPNQHLAGLPTSGQPGWSERPMDRRSIGTETQLVSAEIPIHAVNLGLCGFQPV